MGTQKLKTRTENYDTTLKVALTDKEVLSYAKEAADTIKKGAQLETELASMKKQKQAEIDVCAATVTGLSEKISTRSEYRTVKCSRTYDYQALRVTERRLDTGEGLHEREMSESERQMRLELATEDASEAPPTRTPPGVTEDQVNAAVEIIRETHRATTTTMQRRLGLTADEAQALLTALEARGIVGPPQASGGRMILIDLDEKPAKN